MTDTVRLFVTGGTFDKEYDELTGSLFFRDTHLRDMLKLGRCLLDVEVRTIMMIDSLEMTDADRAAIRQAVEESVEPAHKPEDPVLRIEPRGE